MKYTGTLLVLFVLFSCERLIEPAPPTVDSVIISPSEAELFVGDTLQFNAVVEGTGEFDSALVWYVNNALSGNVMYGTVTQNGFYTTPDTVPPDSQVTIQAVSVADTSKFASALVTILDDTTSDDTTITPTVTLVTISPSEAELFVGDTLQFNAVVEGTGEFDPRVTWFVNGIGGDNSTYGAITTAGLYTAPTSVPESGQALVGVRSVADTGRWDLATIQVLEPEPTITSVTVSPSEAQLLVDATVQFTTEVSGTGDFNPNVSWRVNSIVGGTIEYGTITLEGLYIAPELVPVAQVLVQVVSVVDSTKRDSVVVSVYSVESVTVSPQYMTVEIAQTLQFTAEVAGTGSFDQGVFWYVNSVEGGADAYGTVASDGLYRAPDTVPARARVWVSAWSIADSLVSDSAIVDLYIIDSVFITPQPDSLYVHQEQKFSMLLYGEGNPPGFVNYSINGVEGGSERYGYIDGSIYTAPPTVPYGRFYPWDTETITVRVALTEDPDRYSATTSFFITSGITRLGISPLLPRAVPGDTIQFTVTIYGNPVDNSVKWLVGDGMGGGYYEGGNSEYGTISETGLYVAPSEIPQGTDVFVLVQSAVDIQKNATADIVNF